MNLSTLTPKALLIYSARIVAELRAREIARTENNPISDYTEWLVSDKLSLRRMPSSKKGFDAVDERTGLRYEVKSRRITQRNKSLQLSAIRDINGKHFDFLVAVVFDQDFEIIRALKVPHSVVKRVGRYNEHTNSLLLYADEKLSAKKGVEDISAKLM